MFFGYEVYDDNVRSYKFLEEIRFRPEAFSFVMENSFSIHTIFSFFSESFQISFFTHVFEFKSEGSSINLENNFVTYEIREDQNDVLINLNNTCMIVFTEVSFIHVLIGEGSRLNKKTHFDMNASVIVFQFQLQSNNTEKFKKKKQRKIEKKIEPQLLMSMFDESKNVYDQFISIQQVLKDNKVDLI